MNARDRWHLFRTIATLTVPIVSSSLPAFLIGVLAPALTKAFEVSSATVGWTVMIFFGASSASAYLVGSRIDNSDGRVVLLVAMAALSTGLAVCALAVSRLTFMAGVVVCGSANGGIPPAVYRLVWVRIARPRRGLFFAATQAGFPAATVVAGVIAPSAESLGSWRLPFLASALLVLLATVAAGARTRVGNPVDSIGPGYVVMARSTSAERGGARSGRFGLPMLVMTSSIGSAATAALTTYFVLFLVSRGLSATSAGMMTALGGLSAIGVRVTAGFFADRAKRVVLRAVCGLLLIGSTGVAALGLSHGRILVVATLLSFGAGWGWSGLLSFATVRGFTSSPARSAGLVMTVGGSLGSAMGPPVLAVVVAAAGYDAAWRAVAVLMAAAALSAAAADHCLSLALHSDDC